MIVALIVFAVALGIPLLLNAWRIKGTWLRLARNADVLAESWERHLRPADAQHQREQAAKFRRKAWPRRADQ